MQTFQDLIDELRRINTSDPEVADRYIAIVEVKAVKVVKFHARNGAGGCFEQLEILDDWSKYIPPNAPKARPTPQYVARDPRKITQHLRIIWGCIMRHVAGVYPDSFPSADLVGGFHITEFSACEQQSMCSRDYSPVNWQRRLEDDCQVLAILAEDAENNKSTLAELTHSARRCAEYIRQNPGQTGDNIAHGTRPRISPGHFRSEVVPKLKAHGFYNDGDGYFPPPRPE